MADGTEGCSTHDYPKGHAPWMRYGRLPTQTARAVRFIARKLSGKAGGWLADNSDTWGIQRRFAWPLLPGEAGLQPRGGSRAA